MRGWSWVGAGVVVFGASACSSTPDGDPEVPDRTSSPVVSSASSASPAPDPAAVTPEGPPASKELPSEKSLSLVVDLKSDWGVSVIGDTIGFLDASDDGSGHGVWGDHVADAYELVGTSFQRINPKPIKVRAGSPTGIRVEGTTTFLEVQKEAGRGVAMEFLPIRGTGKLARVADLRGAAYENWQRHMPPDCGEPAKADKEPMERVYDYATYDGKTFLVGESCKGESVLQVTGNPTRWFPAPKEAKLVASKKALYLSTPDLARWNGDRFAEPEPLPGEGQATALYDTSDGALVLTLERLANPGKNYQTKDSHFILRSGQWKRLLLPDDQADYEMHPGETTLWAFSEKGKIHRYVPPGSPAPQRVEDSALTTSRKTPYRNAQAFSRKTAGPNCLRNLVVLYGFTKVTPDDYDFPLTRKALKGHTWVGSLARFAVTEEFGKKYLVAEVFSYEVGLDLAKLIEKGVEGSKPQVVCAEPTILRRIEIDFETGELISNTPANE